jgi:hypothetical protein
MAERLDPKESAKTDGTPAPAVRERYEKPAVAWQDILETRPGLMAGCAKVAGQSPECDAAISS